MIVETCPVCGAVLQHTVVCTNPPIPCLDCPSCGWHWEGEPEPVEYVPFREGGGQDTWSGLETQEKSHKWGTRREKA